MKQTTNLVHLPPTKYARNNYIAMISCGSFCRIMKTMHPPLISFCQQLDNSVTYYNIIEVIAPTFYPIQPHDACLLLDLTLTKITN